MNDKNELITMFLAGVSWERRRDDKPAIRTAIQQAMSQIRVAEQRDAPVHAEQKCRDCGGTGYLVDMEGNEHECLLCQ